LLSSLRPPPSSTLFPYTTLFRSLLVRVRRLVGQERVDLGRRRRQSCEVVCHPPQQCRLVGFRRRRQLFTLETREDESIDGVASPDRKSTRLNSSHVSISYAVFCL